MPVLSILACGMLEDELVHVLSNDPEIKQLLVVDKTNSLKFIRRLKSANLRPLVFPSDRLYSLVSEINNRPPASVKMLFSKLSFFKRKSDATNEKKKQQITVIVNLLKKTCILISMFCIQALYVSR